MRRLDSRVTTACWALARFTLELRTREGPRLKITPPTPLRKGGIIGSLAIPFPPVAKGGQGR